MDKAKSSGLRQWLEALYSLPFNLVAGNWSHTLTDRDYKRLRFLCFASSIGFLYTVGLSFSDYGLHDPADFSLDIILMAAIAGHFVLTRFTGWYRLFYWSTIIVLTAVIFANYFTPTATRTIYLQPMILIFAYFLLGKNIGVIWTFLLLFLNAVSFVIGNSGELRLYVDAHNLAYVSLAVVLSSAFLYIYEVANDANERRVAERDARIKRVNDELNEQLTERYKLEIELKKSLQATNVKNQQLEVAQDKLTKALNMSNRLSEELRLEKEGVEHQVELRTKELREEQARLNASIATLELGFLMTLHDGTVITYNPALLRICGLSEDLSESTVLEALSQKFGDNYDLKQSIENCLRSRKSFEASDLPIGDKFVRILGAAIRLSGAEGAIGTVLLFEDMTKAKMLERIEDEFVAIASHELRTPLTIIQGYISNIKEIYPDKAVDKDIRHLLENINDSTERMVIIVNQFLTMTRLEQRKTLFQLEAVDIHVAVNDAVSHMRQLAEQKGLKIWINLPVDPPPVKADASRLQEVLVNLISNGIKFTEEGQIEITAQRSGKRLAISVADTGKGISAKNQALLFHKFQQATDNIYTREDGRSTGLGLYISKLLVEQMGGSIKLERSAPGKGTTFTFWLQVA